MANYPNEEMQAEANRREYWRLVNSLTPADLYGYDYDDYHHYEDLYGYDPHDYGYDPYDPYEDDESSEELEETEFEVGETVEIKKEECSFRINTNFFDKVPQDFTEIIGKKVKIVQIFDDGDYAVKYNDKTFTVKQKNLVKCISPSECLDIPSDSDCQDKNIDALFDTIIDNNLDQVSALIDITGPNIKMKNTYPLMLAVQRGHKNIVKFLLEKKADVDMRDYCGDTPLHCAAQGNKIEICSLLLEHGADVNSLNNRKDTPISLAACMGKNDVLKLLASREEADLTIGSSGGKTALHSAIHCSHIDCIETLLDFGGYPKFVSGRSCPFYMVINEDYEGRSLKVFELLLSKVGPSVINASKGEQHLIHHVILYNEIECLVPMIKYGADVNVRNKLSQTPLHLAVKIHNIAKVKLLVENKADLELKDERELTPLHYAIYLFCKDNLKEMFSDFDDELDGDCDDEMHEDLFLNPKKMRAIVIYLARAGAQIYKKNKYGQSPIEGCKDESLKKELLAIQAEKKIPKTAKIASISRKSVEVGKSVSKEVKELREEMRDEDLCKMCNDRNRSTVFGCGHTACDDCANTLSECRLCHLKISVKIKMLD